LVLISTTPIAAQIGGYFAGPVVLIISREL